MRWGGNIHVSIPQEPWKKKMGLGSYKQESPWREAHRHRSRCPGQSGAELFVQYGLLTSRLCYQLNWEVLSTRSREALPNTSILILLMSLSFHVPMSFTAGLDPQGGCLSGVLRSSSSGLQQWEALPNTPQKAREEGCQAGTMKTTLKLSLFGVVFVLLSCLRMFWGFDGCSGNRMILCGNENVIYKNPLQTSDN